MVNILVIAPHADDETLGCGGTISRFAREGAHITVAVMEGHGGIANRMGPPELWEIKDAECRSACELLGVSTVVFANEPSTVVQNDRTIYDYNAATQRIVREAAPDVIFAPWPYDLHGDHRDAFHSFAVHWRPYLPLGAHIGEVFLYETISETHLTSPVEPAFAPDTWINLTDADLDAKIEAFECYETQVQAHPSARSTTALRSLAVWRGSQIGTAAAEAFVTMRRVVR